jgi:hypothetical protein
LTGRLTASAHASRRSTPESVELNGAATRQSSYRHERVLIRKEHVTTLARFSGAWTTQGPRNAVIRQATISELAPDQEADNIVGYREFHTSLQCICGFDIRQIHRSLDARERQTGEARVQASNDSTGAVQSAGAYTERRPGAARKDGRSGRSPGAGCNWRKCLGGWRSRTHPDIWRRPGPTRNTSR